MAQVIEYECVMCGTVKESDRPMRTCSPKCRKAYQRYKERGGEELDYCPLSRVSQHGVTTPPAHEQAESDDQDYVKVPRELYELLLYRLATMDTAEKKSDFVLGQPTFTPPTEKPVVREIPDEERIKRTAANTAAALDDF